MPHRHKVLIIEDDPDSGPAYVRECAKDGLVATLVSSLHDGLREARETSFRVIVLDPGLQDNDLPTEYSALERIPVLQASGARVIVHTASGDPNMIKVAGDYGAAHVEKGPRQVDVLMAAIWIEINANGADHDSAVRQQIAQRRVQQPSAPLAPETKVSLSFSQMWAVIAAVVVGTAVVCTGSVSIKHDIKEVSATLTEIREADKIRDEALQKRLADWNPWRWSVTLDLRRLGEATHTSVTTPDTKN